MVLGRELNQAKSKPDTVDWPVRTARTFVQHYNSTQYCSTETVLLILPFLQTNISSRIISGGNIGQRDTFGRCTDCDDQPHVRSYDSAQLHSEIARCCSLALQSYTEHKLHSVYHTNTYKVWLKTYSMKKQFLTNGSVFLL